MNQHAAGEGDATKTVEDALRGIRPGVAMQSIHRPRVAIAVRGRYAFTHVGGDSHPVAIESPPATRSIR
jgi:hypothetical protein